MNIRDIRKETGLTQKEFAEVYMISLPTLRRWEQNVTKPPEYLMRLLAYATHLKDNTVIKYKGENRNYYYNPVEKTVSTDNGDVIRVSEDITDVKKENIGLYLDELFDDLENAKQFFRESCVEDRRSDIVWSKP